MKHQLKLFSAKILLMLIEIKFYWIACYDHYRDWRFYILTIYIYMYIDASGCESAFRFYRKLKTENYSMKVFRISEALNHSHPLEYRVWCGQLLLCWIFFFRCNEKVPSNWRYVQIHWQSFIFIFISISIELIRFSEFKLSSFFLL